MWTYFQIIRSFKSHLLPYLYVRYPFKRHIWKLSWMVYSFMWHMSTYILPINSYSRHIGTYSWKSVFFFKNWYTRNISRLYIFKTDTYSLIFEPYKSLIGKYIYIFELLYAIFPLESFIMRSITSCITSHHVSRLITYHISNVKWKKKKRPVCMWD